MDALDRKYVLAVAREQSFSRAARMLYISQPSLSAYIIKLEKEIGCKLFDRSASPVTLTDAGREFVACAKRMEELETGLEEYLSDLANLQAGQITVGGSHFYCACFLPAVITAFCKSYPGVRLSLVEDHFPKLMELLAEGTLDCVVDYPLDPAPNFLSAPLKQEYILIAAPENWKESGKWRRYKLQLEDVIACRHLKEDWPRIPLSAFAEEDFLFLNSEHNLYALGMRLCKNAGFRPRIKMVLNELLTSYAFSMAGHGVSFVSDTVVQFGNFARAPALYAVSDPQSRRFSSLIRKKNRYESKAMKAFLKMLQDFAAGKIEAGK